MNSLIHKHCQRRCKSSREPRGSKRGLVLNLCLLNLEMTSSVRYNLILTITNQIALTDTNVQGDSEPWKVTGSKGVISIVALLWEIVTDMCGNILQRIDFSCKWKTNPASNLQRDSGVGVGGACVYTIDIFRLQTKGIMTRLLRPKLFEQVTGIVQDVLIWVWEITEKTRCIFRKLIITSWKCFFN